MVYSLSFPHLIKNRERNDYACKTDDVLNRNIKLYVRKTSICWVEYKLERIPLERLLSVSLMLIEDLSPGRTFTEEIKGHLHPRKLWIDSPRNLTLMSSRTNFYEPLRPRNKKSKSSVKRVLKPKLPKDCSQKGNGCVNIFFRVAFF